MKTKKETTALKKLIDGKGYGPPADYERKKQRGLWLTKHLNESCVRLTNGKIISEDTGYRSDRVELKKNQIGSTNLKQRVAMKSSENGIEINPTSGFMCQIDIYHEGKNLPETVKFVIYWSDYLTYQHYLTLPYEPNYGAPLPDSIDKDSREYYKRFGYGGDFYKDVLFVICYGFSYKTGGPLYMNVFTLQDIMKKFDLRFPKQSGKLRNRRRNRLLFSCSKGFPTICIDEEVNNANLIPNELILPDTIENLFISAHLRSKEEQSDLEALFRQWGFFGICGENNSESARVHRLHKGSGKRSRGLLLS